MGLERLKQQLDFLVEIDQLKGIVRRTYLVNKDRLENSAEHSWHVAMMAMLLYEYSEENIDPLRALKMLLIHDVVEIDAGDTYIYDEVGKQDKEEREKVAADRIFGLLPGDQGKELRDIWDEFEAKITPEAKFATSLDRLMPLLHNFHTQGKGWKEHGITRQQVIQINKKIQAGSETLWQYAQSIIEESVERGYLAP